MSVKGSPANFLDSYIQRLVESVLYQPHQLENPFMAGYKSGKGSTPSARASTRPRRNQMSPSERAAKPSYKAGKAKSKGRPRSKSR